jgi:tetratricopeptide (TPR) repeat protein
MTVVISCSGCFKAAKHEGVFDERHFERDVAAAFVGWAESGSWSDARECDSLTAWVLEVERPGAEALFLAAQFSHLRGNTKRAVSLLDKAIDTYPDARAPGTSLPVKILGRLWMGTMQRQSGDGPGAVETYEAVKQILNIEEGEHRLVLAVCCLNIAQVASRSNRNRDLFIRETDALLGIDKTSDTNLADCLDFFQKWALYARAKKSKGKDIALKEMAAPQSVSPYIGVGYANVNGMFPYNGLGANEELVWKRQASKVKAMRFGDFDKGVMRWVFGFSYWTNKDYNQGDKYLEGLLKDRTFFSPVAGVWLAVSKSQQGKETEALAVLDEVAASYPGYAEIVDERKKQIAEQDGGG